MDHWPLGKSVVGPDVLLELLFLKLQCCFLCKDLCRESYIDQVAGCYSEAVRLSPERREDFLLPCHAEDRQFRKGRRFVPSPSRL